MRRPRVEWMTLADDAILEWMENEPSDAIRANPAVVAANVEYGRSHVTKRMRELLKGGLLEYHDEERAIYQITDRGRAYLAGELDADDLERDEE